MSPSISCFFSDTSETSVVQVPKANKNVQTVTFVGLPKEKEILKSKTVQITISVGFSDKHQGEDFAITLKKILPMFKNIVIMVDDLVQWRTLRLSYPKMTDAELKDLAIENGEKWIASNLENLLTDFSEEERAKIHIVRWKDFNSDKVNKAVEAFTKKCAEFHGEKVSVASIETLEKGKEPNKDLIYVRAAGNKLLYHVWMLMKKDDKGMIKAPEELELQLPEDSELAKLLKKRSEEQLEDPTLADLTWHEIRDYISEICAAFRPLALGIELTSEEFANRQPLEVHQRWTHDEIKALSREYLLEECAIMNEIWPTAVNDASPDFEIYVSERTAAMKAVHYYLLQQENASKELLNSIHIIFKHSKIKTASTDIVSVGHFRVSKLECHENNNKTSNTLGYDN